MVKRTPFLETRATKRRIRRLGAWRDKLSHSIRITIAHVPNFYNGHDIGSIYRERRHLEDVWLEFLNYPEEQQLFENAATILTQWYQPQKRIYDFDIEASLDDIAQQTLNSLKKVHWDHPIFSTSAKQFSFWKSNNIDDNQWSKIEGKQIIDVLLMVLFDELGFHLHSTHNPKPEDIFIDCVLESKIGNALTLAIIFQSVARRLGVRCDLVRSVLGWLCWKPKSIAENEDEEYFYIDILHGGTVRGRNDCPIESYNKHEKINFATSMVLIMHSELKMDTFINQDWTPLLIPFHMYIYVESAMSDINYKDLYWIGKMYNIMNMSEFLSLIHRGSLQRILDNYNNRKSVESRRTEDILRTFEMSVQHKNLKRYTRKPIPKERTRSMKYAVGMIVSCIKNYPNQIGVIIGWCEKFNRHVDIRYRYTTVLSDPQIRGDSYYHQPFYIILSEDGNVYYAAQDTVIEACPRWIEHSEIGRYFCRFADVYYVPNEVLSSHYPNDQHFLNYYYSGHFY